MSEPEVIKAEVTPTIINVSGSTPTTLRRLAETVAVGILAIVLSVGISFYLTREKVAPVNPVNPITPIQPKEPDEDNPIIASNSYDLPVGEAVTVRVRYLGEVFWGIDPEFSSFVQVLNGSSPGEKHFVARKTFSTRFISVFCMWKTKENEVRKSDFLWISVKSGQAPIPPPDNPPDNPPDIPVKPKPKPVDPKSDPALVTSFVESLKKDNDKVNAAKMASVFLKGAILLESKDPLPDVGSFYNKMFNTSVEDGIPRLPALQYSRRVVAGYLGGPLDESVPIDPIRPSLAAKYRTLAASLQEALKL